MLSHAAVLYAMIPEIFSESYRQITVTMVIPAWRCAEHPCSPLRFSRCNSKGIPRVRTTHAWVTMAEDITGESPVCRWLCSMRKIWISFLKASACCWQSTRITAQQGHAQQSCYSMLQSVLHSSWHHLSPELTTIVELDNAVIKIFLMKGNGRVLYNMVCKCSMYIYYMTFTQNAAWYKKWHCKRW